HTGRPLALHLSAADAGTAAGAAAQSDTRARQLLAGSGDCTRLCRAHDDGDAVLPDGAAAQGHRPVRHRCNFLFSSLSRRGTAGRGACACAAAVRSRSLAVARRTDLDGLGAAERWAGAAAVGARHAYVGVAQTATLAL